MSAPTVETERLVLREWTQVDGVNLDKHCNTPDVMGWLGGPLPPRKHRQLVQWLISQQNHFGHTFWVVERKCDDAFLGFCGLVKVDEADSPIFDCIEIGWRFRADEHRKGYGLEAAIASVDFAFDKLTVNRLVSRTVLQNIPSWKLMHKLGMWHEPRLDHWHEDGEAMITHVIHRDDWPASREQAFNHLRAA